MQALMALWNSLPHLSVLSPTIESVKRFASASASSSLIEALGRLCRT